MSGTPATSTASPPPLPPPPPPRGAGQGDARGVVDTTNVTPAPVSISVDVGVPTPMESPSPSPSPSVSPPVDHAGKRRSTISDGEDDPDLVELGPAVVSSVDATVTSGVAVTPVPGRKDGYASLDVELGYDDAVGSRMRSAAARRTAAFNKARLVYFLNFAALSFVSPFGPTFFEKFVGLNRRQIGILRALSPLLGVFGAPAFGVVADKWNAHALVMAGSMLVPGMLWVVLSLEPVYSLGFWGVFMFVFVISLIASGRNSTIDASVMALIADTEEQMIEAATQDESDRAGDTSTDDQNVDDDTIIVAGAGGGASEGGEVADAVHDELALSVGSDSTHRGGDGAITGGGEGAPLQHSPRAESAVAPAPVRNAKTLGHYGKIRMWGAVGWGLCAPMAGLLIDAQQTTMTGSFAVAMVLMLCSANVARQFPQPQPKAGSQRTKYAFPRELFQQSEFRLFLVVIWIMGTCAGTIASYLVLYITELGGNSTIMGLSLTFTCVAEVPIFFISGRLIARWGELRVLLLALVCYVVRVVFYTLVDDPWLILIAEPLHGVTFGAAWAAATSYAASIAPPGTGATVQGMVSGVHWGIGSGGGAIIGGILYDTVGSRWMFRAVALVASCGIALLLTVEYQRAQRQRKSQSYDALATVPSVADDAAESVADVSSTGGASSEEAKPSELDRAVDVDWAPRLSESGATSFGRSRDDLSELVP